MSRASHVLTVMNQLNDLTRRGRSIARIALPEIGFGAYTLLTHIRATDGCRASDLATHYVLEKSTVSRQIAELVDAGLVARSIDPLDARAQILRLTEAGAGVLEEADTALHAAVARRLADWNDGEVTAFAAMLLRYNRPQVT